MSTYVRNNVPTPPANAQTATVQAGTYTALTDTFNLVLDLNDASNFLVKPGTLKIAQPTKSFVQSSNVRTPGVRIVRTQYQDRVVSWTFSVRGATTAALIANVRAFIAACETTPWVLRYAPPGATQYSYLDVTRIEHTLDVDSIHFNAKVLVDCTIAMRCQPGIRGDRLTLQNLVANPGFEAPGGGGITTAPTPGFQDTLQNLFAYTTIAGTAPSQAGISNTYVDIVLNNGGANLILYYRLDETSGTSVYDIAGMGYTGTTHGSPTQNVAGLLSGASDPCYTFAAASSQYVSVPTTSAFPSANQAMSIGFLMQIAANPGATQTMCGYGTSGTTHQSINVNVNSTGHIVCDIGGGGASITSTAAIAAGAAHMAVVTWDGTTMTLYVDGAATGGTITPGNQAIPASPTVNWAANNTPTNYFSGQLDECCIWNTALNSTQVSNLWTAASAGPTGNLANAMKLPTSSQIQFGSPIWSAINAWQVRFRFISGLDMRFFLHYVDGNNYVQAEVTRTAIVLSHKVAGVLTTIQSATLPTSGLTLQAYYWLSFTQFPTPNDSAATTRDVPYLSASLYYDDNGVVGTQVAGSVAAGPALDPTAGLTGKPQILCQAGGAATLGGSPAASLISNQVLLFGPGGWSALSAGSGAGGMSVTGPASGSWDQNTANTATLGLVNANASNQVQVPVTSTGAARLDIAPGAGAIDARWSTNTTSLTQLMPVPGGPGSGIQFGWTYAAKTTGFAGTARIQLYITEYNSSGTLLSTNQVSSVTPPAVWNGYAGTYTTGNAACAYLSLFIRALDTATGTSVGATLWLDNVQLWCITSTAMSTMPYCELRMPNSPAQLMVSGVQGDMATPAALLLGTYLSSWPTGSTLHATLGRMAQPSATAGLTGVTHGFYGTAIGQQATAVLDIASYGGFYAQFVMATSWSVKAFSPTAADVSGTFHLWQRFQSAQTVGNLGNVQVRANTQQRTQPWYGTAGSPDALGNAYGQFLAPLAAQSTWTSVDAGQVALPPFPASVLANPATLYLVPHPQWQDLTGGGANAEANWQLLLPVDASLVGALLNNPANGGNNVATEWLWSYVDGLGVQVGQSAAAAYSLESGALPNPARGGGGAGTQATGYIGINVNVAGDAYLTLDPEQQVGATVVNEFGGVISDGNAAVLPMYGEMQYSPLYLYPR